MESLRRHPVVPEPMTQRRLAAYRSSPSARARATAGCGWPHRACRGCGRRLLDGVDRDHQLVGDLLVGPARGQQQKHLQLPVAQRLHPVPQPRELLGRARGRVCAARLERPRQPVQVARRDRTGERDPLPVRWAAASLPSRRAMGALVDEHAYVALGAGQRQRLGQGVQRGGAGPGAGVRRALSSCGRELISGLR